MTMVNQTAENEALDRTRKTRRLLGALAQEIGDVEAWSGEAGAFVRQMVERMTLHPDGVVSDAQVQWVERLHRSFCG